MKSELFKLLRKAIQEPLKNSPDANPYFILELLEQFLPKYSRIPNKIGRPNSSNKNRRVYIAHDPFDAAKSIILKELICIEEQEYNPSDLFSHYKIIQELISNS